MTQLTVSNIIAIAMIVFAPHAVADVLPKFVPGSTAKVLQLTGDFDRQLQQPTLNLTETRFGIRAVDLGYAFEHKGRLCFLLGDAHADGWRYDRSPVAYSTSTDPENLLIDVLMDDDGFHPITIPGITHGAFEVPAGGISVADTMYIVYTTDHKTLPGYPWHMGRSVMAKSVDDGRTFENLYDLSDRRDDGKFINVSMVEVEPGELDGLPTTEKTVLIWGSGEYRASSPYLAYVPSGSIDTKSSIRYFTGLTESGDPLWSAAETDATTLFDHPQIGEFSVERIEEMGYWIMLYNAVNPYGILFRYAKHPWGPWSDPQVMVDPAKDTYGRFIHSPADPVPGGVSLSDPGREKVRGGHYAPYMLKRYFTHRGSGRYTIFYLMSTWNPYQVVVMKSDIQFP